jgi:hypothetical protein
VDLDTRRRKQRELMARAVERKVRSRAQQLYVSRGQEEGKELQDWFQAESEILENNAIGSLYRKLYISEPSASEPDSAELIEHLSTCETGA